MSDEPQSILNNIPCGGCGNPIVGLGISPACVLIADFGCGRVQEVLPDGRLDMIIEVGENCVERRPYQIIQNLMKELGRFLDMQGGCLALIDGHRFLKENPGHVK